MKITKILVPVLLATAAFSMSAHAQTFGSSTSASTDTDVYVGGETALAWDFSDFNDSTTTKVNGVTFSGDQDNAATGVDFSFVLNNAGHDQNGVIAADLAPTATTNYANILQHLAYTGTQPGSLTFTGLTAGDTYVLQVFAGGGQSNPETLTDSSTIASPNSPSGTLDYGLAYNTAVAGFIDETFKAPVGGTETIDLTGPGLIIVSAVNLQLVPEPSTYVMLLGGLGCLIFLVRRKAFGTV